MVTTTTTASSKKSGGYLTDFPSEADPIKRLFSSQYLYEAVTYGGCGCGFHYSLEHLNYESKRGLSPELEKSARDDYEDGRRSVAFLSRAVRSALMEGPVEMYACWDGDWSSDPVTTDTVEEDFFGGDGDSFCLEEKSFFNVIKRS